MGAAMEKKVSRLKRARRSRAKIHELRAVRLSVHRTAQHIYAQVFDPESKVIASASTLQKDVAEGLKGTGNVEAAKAVGKAIAERAKAQGHHPGRVRPLGLQVSRAHQGARRSRA